MANQTTEKKATFTGQNAKQLWTSNELKKTSSKVSKVLNAQFKDAKEPNKVYKYHKEGLSIENVVTTRQTFNYAKYIKANPKDEAKLAKFFFPQTVQTITVKELKSK